jgi:hypothetical protein
VSSLGDREPDVSDPNSIRSKAKECGLNESTLRYRLKQGMTLDEAMTLARGKGRRPPPPPGLGRSGGKSEDKETFHQYFVDTLRVWYGLAPLYRKK